MIVKNLEKTSSNMSNCSSIYREKTSNTRNNFSNENCVSLENGAYLLGITISCKAKPAINCFGRLQYINTGFSFTEHPRPNIITASITLK